MGAHSPLTWKEYMLNIMNFVFTIYLNTYYWIELEQSKVWDLCQYLRHLIWMNGQNVLLSCCTLNHDVCFQISSVRQQNSLWICCKQEKSYATRFAIWLWCFGTPYLYWNNATTSQQTPCHLREQFECSRGETGWSKNSWCVQVFPCEVGIFAPKYVQGSHAVLKVLNCEICFQDLERVLNLAKMYIMYC